MFEELKRTMVEFDKIPKQSCDSIVCTEESYKRLLQFIPAVRVTGRIPLASLPVHVAKDSEEARKMVEELQSRGKKPMLWGE